MVTALWLLFAVLLVAWFVGFALHLGLLTWLLLASACALLLLSLFASRKIRRWS